MMVEELTSETSLPIFFSDENSNFISESHAINNFNLKNSII
jgi:hypothetical protein